MKAAALLIAVAGVCLLSVEGFGGSKAGSEYADLVYLNARIYTVNKQQPWAEALAVRGNVLVHVGDNAGAEAMVGPDTDVRDAGGDFISPGFVDSHTHTALGSILATAAQIPAEPLSAIQQAIKDHVAAYPDAEGYLGMGWALSSFPNESPTSAMLDEIVSDKPALMLDSGGHAGWANTKFMEMMGYDENTPDIEPGLYYLARDEQGKPTGYLKGAYTYFEGVSKMGVITPEALEVVFPAAATVYSSQGITAVYDAGVGEHFQPIVYPYLKQLAEKDELDMRYMASHWVQTKQQAPTAPAILRELSKEYDTDIFRVNTLKIHNDGIFEIHTAGMLEDYADYPGNKGMVLLEGEPLNELLLAVAEDGMHAHLHSIGDRTARAALDAFEVVRNAGYKDNRLTVGHIQLVDEEDIARFGELDAIAQTSPMWFGYGGELTLNRLGEERFNRMFSIKSIADTGGTVALGADWPASGGPIEYQAPLLGLQVAKDRKMPPLSYLDQRIQEPVDQRMDIESMYTMHTLDSAKVIGMDDKIGSLEVGKYADFVRLSGNPIEGDQGEVWKIGIKETWMDGKLRFEGDGSPVYETEG